MTAYLLGVASGLGLAYAGVMVFAWVWGNKWRGK